MESILIYSIILVLGICIGYFVNDLMEKFESLCLVENRNDPTYSQFNFFPADYCPPGMTKLPKQDYPKYYRL